MFISAVLPLMSIYKLPRGQLGYRGHVISFPQNITTIAHTLPRTPSDLQILLLRKEGRNKSHHDFKVRKCVVLKALQWLIKNNKYYKNIKISHETLNQLPEDGDLTNSFSQIQIGDDEDPVQVFEKDTNSLDTTSFVPIVSKKKRQ